MSYVRVRLHKDILWLILDRPPLNILTIEMLDQLTAAMRDAVKHPPHLIVLTGAGERAFCAGVDIHDHLDGRESEMLRAVYDNCAAFEELRSHHIPTAALVIRNDGAFVPVLDQQNRVHYRKVERGRDYGAEVEILTGLDGGEAVVVYPGDALPEGQEVEPVPAPK